MFNNVLQKRSKFPLLISLLPPAFGCGVNRAWLQRDVRKGTLLHASGVKYIIWKSALYDTLNALYDTLNYINQNGDIINWRAGASPPFFVEFAEFLLYLFIYLYRGFYIIISGFYLLGGQGGSFPKKCQSSPPNIFIRFGKTLLSNSHTLAINFYQQLIRFKVQNCVMHRVSINRSCQCWQVFDNTIPQFS